MGVVVAHAPHDPSPEPATPRTFERNAVAPRHRCVNFARRDVCRALDLDPGTPVALCDARERDSGKEVLIQLVEHAGRMHTARLLDSVG
ncbi:hypothetical protein RKD47_005653 [Streptomyces albogriseolus]